MLKTIAAFASQEGGTVLIGVRDDLQFVGLPEGANIDKQVPPSYTTTAASTCAMSRGGWRSPLRTSTAWRPERPGSGRRFYLRCGRIADSGYRRRRCAMPHRKRSSGWAVMSSTA
ncbi:AlbA family DNA-binding domain-containing protein [Streptomyces aurantiacus]|uniref:AlbA family DNA-binding domain-containing protein n=1 Tax=Streptomyces aurantiacus TaxID=47760 RepID=UPI0027D927A7|nr:ATP-binding protein [Streptomyces aurantiacus]